MESWVAVAWQVEGAVRPWAQAVTELTLPYPKAGSSWCLHIQKGGDCAPLASSRSSHLTCQGNTLSHNHLPALPAPLPTSYTLGALHCVGKLAQSTKLKSGHDNSRYLSGSTVCQRKRPPQNPPTLVLVYWAQAPHLLPPPAWEQI